MATAGLSLSVNTQSQSHSHDYDGENDIMKEKPRRKSKAALTPPETPIAERRRSASGSASGSDSVPGSPNYHHHPSHTEPLEFVHDIEIARGPDGRYVEFGRGVWSAVYKATSTWSSSPSERPQAAAVSLFTPPASPTPSSTSILRRNGHSNSRILAVKTPLRRDAHPVLKAEAHMLSFITRHNSKTAQTHTVPFYGSIADSHSLVLQAIPLSLARHIEDRAVLARKHFSTKTMFDPVLSSAHWRDLAAQLIRGLDWLHNTVGVVHGDIKPHNILLREKEVVDTDAEFPYDAVYADFSSAHLISSSSSSPNQDGESSAMGSALTPPFAAPELMSVAALRADVSCTPASDVFALALTLLAGATGETMVYSSGTSEMQRLAMARDGHRAVDYVRSGPQASRVVRGGMVEKTVAPAVKKEPAERVAAAEWEVSMST